MKILSLLNTFNGVLGLAITLLYAYQAVYVAVGLLTRKKERASITESGELLRRYAVLISARNEEAVIGELIAGLKAQNYPRELLDIYVVADNCTDRTAQRAREAGAKVYRRFDRMEVGKGYALNYLLTQIALDGHGEDYAGYFVFDADNIVDQNFVREMNRTFDPKLHGAVTGYRNSKNFGQNWISAANSIWFLREARFVNSARKALGLTCHVSGTGFLVSADVIREKGGWVYHLLTEDLEFSAESAVLGRKIAYCENAVIYDEQPTSFRQSWDQRKRWAKGFFQVSGKYSPALLKGMCHGGRHGLECYDIFMLIAPGNLLTVLGGGFQIATIFCLLMAPDYALKQVLVMTLDFLRNTFAAFYISMLSVAVLTVLSEWENIHAPNWQKVIYLPLFPIFMLSYLPLTVTAMVQKKVEWKPIRHQPLSRLDRVA